MIQIGDNDRRKCGFFSSAKEFDTEPGAKYRKPLLLLATFSLIYNFAGINITGTGIGIISGTISNPSVVGIALLLALIYYLLVYLSIAWVRHEEFYMSVTDFGSQHGFGESLVRYIAEHKIKQFLVSKDIDLSRIEFHKYDQKGLEHYFRIHGVKKHEPDQIREILSDVCIRRVENRDTKQYFYQFEYKLSEEDLDYFKKHFKYLKLLHLQNFIEFRMPYIVAILAISSFYLSFSK